MAFSRLPGRLIRPSPDRLARLGMRRAEAVLRLCTRLAAVGRNTYTLPQQLPSRRGVAAKGFWAAEQATAGAPRPASPGRPGPTLLHLVRPGLYDRCGLRLWYGSWGSARSPRRAR